MKKIAALILCAALVLCVITGCTNEAVPLSAQGFYFNTYIKITVYSDDEAVLDGAVDICEKLDRLLDKNKETSDIYRINHAHGQPVEVDKLTADVIEKGMYYSELSGGIFDITCGSATALWDFTSGSDIIPDEDARNAAAALIDYRNVVIDNNTVAVPDGVMLDLGGIAKGYAADMITEYFEQNGVRDALISLGGNVCTMGDKQGRPWQIGIQSPYSSQQLDVIEISGKRSVVSSGDYERCFEKDGVRYHHILDLATAMPAQSDIRSVTILSESSVMGDALSTICFILGYQRANELIEKTEGVEAIFALSDGSVIYTDENLN